MGKALGSWSGMKKYLEQEMLADSLHGRIRYGCTSYVGMDGCRIFEVCVDGVQVKRFSWETVNTYFINSGYTTNPAPGGVGDYWAEFWTLLKNTRPTSARNIQTRNSARLWKHTAIKTFRRVSVPMTLSSECLWFWTEE